MDDRQQPVALMTVGETIEAIQETIRDYARTADVYVPHIPKLADAIFNRVVNPLVSSAVASQQGGQVGDPGRGNTMYCSNTDEHDTHLWTVPWEPQHLVRCPGRDGV